MGIEHAGSTILMIVTVGKAAGPENRVYVELSRQPKETFDICCRERCGSSTIRAEDFD